MKTKHLSLALLAAVPASLLLADDLPKPFAFDRYQGMMDRSPFAVATAAAAPVATPNFAKDLYVANAAHSKDGDLVTIASSADKNFKKYLNTNTAEDGYTITNIEWSEKVGATKVTIAKDGQTATLTFNEALLHQNVASQPPQQQMPQQQMPQSQVPQPNMQAQPIVPPPNPVVQPNVTRPMPIPSLPTPPARVRGVIPKNPTAGAPVTPIPQPTPEVEL